MSDESSEAEYDLAPIPRPVRPVRPIEQIKPPTLAYQRPVPLNPIPAQSVAPTPRNVLSREEKVAHLLKILGSLGIIGVGLITVWFFSMWIGFTVVGLGAASLIFSGPSDAEKRGYHF
jgi:hypothetical protein